MKPFSWAMVCREPSGDKIVQAGEDEWITQKKATTTGVKIVKYDGVWMIESYATILREERLVLARVKKASDLNLKCGIFRLPLELRLSIYDLAVEAHKLRVFLRGQYGQPTGITLPEVAYTSKQVRTVFLLRQSETTAFSVENGPGNAAFQEWLASVDFSSVSNNYKNGFDAIKALTFPFFSRFPLWVVPIHKPNSNVQLMERCKTLKTVSMGWASVTLFNINTGAGKTMDQLRAEYRIDGLLQLKNLETITLVGFGMSASASPQLQALADWLKSNWSGHPERELEVVLLL
ncbi:hypothetical protein LTR78_002896 [Recurvomyces mirabilis]|uniref:Uncharacterized protein n=1 Tax=Recurvomyces mirabilis TaxID=574656 RepID=A0AAE0WT47_9PEZI|nr:hypothetical protein LTR78_002896 [Recurvomyces mirabilis]KAK5159370.1 hypothetical protein LTS14_002512 [Recurvomyces mirabilis]